MITDFVEARIAEWRLLVAGVERRAGSHRAGESTDPRVTHTADAYPSCGPQLLFPEEVEFAAWPGHPSTITRICDMADFMLVAHSQCPPPYYGAREPNACITCNYGWPCTTIRGVARIWNTHIEFDRSWA